MINKLICWLFGHIAHAWIKINDAVSELKPIAECPRCGVKLTNLSTDKDEK